MKRVYLKILLGNIVIACIIGTLQFFVFASQGLLSPVSVSHDVLDKLMPKLELVRNTYTLKKSPQLFPKAHAASSFDDASAYAVIDFDSGKIILDKNLEEELPIASLTKIMTAVVALDLLDPSEKLAVSQAAATVEPTRAGVTAGEQLTTEELLHALLMTSANDAAQVLQEGVDKKYGASVFIRAMNAKAEFLSLTQSHFVNPQGYDAYGHQSSVRDLAVLSHYALTNYPLIAEIVKKDVVTFEPTATHKRFDLYNWNGLIGVYPNTTGIKIGNTDAAQKTTVVVSERAGHKILAIVLGAPRIIERDEWAADLLDAGYQDVLHLPAIDVTEEMLREKYATWKTWN